jgi:polyisoprenyl-phosphate glycosyltransferase
MNVVGNRRDATPTLSICAPMYREAATVDAFVARVTAAARLSGHRWELIVAEDCSRDATLSALEAVAANVNVNVNNNGPKKGDRNDGDGELVVVALAQNLGQLGATLAALRRARGSRVVVLDSDLQDPPELIPALVARFDRGGVDAVFAVKTERDDAAWLRAGALLYHRAIVSVGARPPPSGAGAYCVMGAALAQALTTLRPGDANLAPLVAQLARSVDTVPYAKAARVDGKSRVGSWGLVREAWGSLVLAGALPAIASRRRRDAGIDDAIARYVAAADEADAAAAMDAAMDAASTGLSGARTLPPASADVRENETPHRR